MLGHLPHHVGDVLAVVQSDVLQLGTVFGEGDDGAVRDVLTLPQVHCAQRVAVRGDCVDGAICEGLTAEDVYLPHVWTVSGDGGDGCVRYLGIATQVKVPQVGATGGQAGDGRVRHSVTTTRLERDQSREGVAVHVCVEERLRRVECVDEDLAREIDVADAQCLKRRGAFQQMNQTREVQQFTSGT